MINLKVRLLTGKNKTIGLINSKSAENVIIRTRFGIHSFGVKFPIDVVILDNMNSVVRIKKDLKPNRLFFWPPMLDLVIELPNGEINKLGIEIGSKINLQIT